MPSPNCDLPTFDYHYGPRVHQRFQLPGILGSILLLSICHLLAINQTFRVAGWAAAMGPWACSGSVHGRGVPCHGSHPRPVRQVQVPSGGSRE